MGFLLETRFFNLLVKNSQTSVSSEELKSAFDDFINSLIKVSNQEKDVVFKLRVLSFTRTKLKTTSVIIDSSNTKKKCTYLAIHRRCSIFY